MPIAFDAEWRPRISHRMAARNVSGRMLILDPQIDRLMRLNSTGTCIWEWIAEDRCSLAELLERLVAQFEVERDQAQSDLLDYLEALIHEGLIDSPTAP